MLTLTFLGTGVSIPTPRRQHSGAVLEHQGTLFLIDCGEGTQTRLMRADLSLLRIEAIFLTHLHGDHLNGLLSLVESMQMYERQTPLRIIGSASTITKAQQLIRISSYREDAFPLRFEIISGGELIAFNQLSVQAIEVPHITGSLGFLFQEKEQLGEFFIEKIKELGIPPGPIYHELHSGKDVTWNGKLLKSSLFVGPPKRGVSVFFSGDTLFYPKLTTQLGSLDVLVHEATYRHEDQKLAVEKKHSTNIQAATIAHLLQPRLLLLTHISTRTSTDHSSPLQLERELVKESRQLFPMTNLAQDFDRYLIHRDQITRLPAIHRRSTSEESVGLLAEV